MNYRLIFALNALVGVVFGIGFLLVPKLALNQFGVDQYESTRLSSQFFGTAILTVGLLAWFARSVEDEGALRGFGMALLAGSLAGLVVAVIGAWTGTMRNLAWLPIVLYALFGLGYAYLVFIKPRMVQ